MSSWSILSALGIYNLIGRRPDTDSLLSPACLLLLMCASLGVTWHKIFSTTCRTCRQFCCYSPPRGIIGEPTYALNIIFQSVYKISHWWGMAVWQKKNSQLGSISGRWQSENGRWKWRWISNQFRGNTNTWLKAEFLNLTGAWELLLNFCCVHNR